MPLAGWGISIELMLQQLSRSTTPAVQYCKRDGETAQEVQRGVAIGRQLEREGGELREVGENDETRLHQGARRAARDVVLSAVLTEKTDPISSEDVRMVACAGALSENIPLAWHLHLAISEAPLVSCPLLRSNIPIEMFPISCSECFRA